MNLFEKLTYGFGKMRGQYHKGLENVFSTSGTRPNISDPTIWGDERYWGEGLLEDKRPRSKQAFVEAYRNWVYICVKLNAHSVAAVPLRLYVAKGTAGQKFSTVTTKAIDTPRLKWLQANSSLERWTSKAVEIEEITDHAFLELERSVNPWNNRRDLYESTSMFLDLTGESYWLLIMNGAGVPDQIWNIPAQYMTPVFGESLEDAIVAFNYKRGNIDVDIPAENIIYFKYPNPHNMFTGFSTVRGIADAVYLGSQMNEFETGLFENRARPGGVFAVKGNISKEERARLEGKLTQKFSGAKKAGKNLMLSGDMTFTRDTMTPEELSYIEGRKINRTEIMASFDVPEAALISESANRANSEAADYRHAKNGILPRLRRIEEKLNEKLIPMYDDKIFVAFDNPVPEDVAFLLEKQVRQVEANIMLRNEVRQEDGLEPTPWGEFAWFDNRLMPVGEDFIPPEIPEEVETPEEEPEEIEEESIMGIPVKAFNRPNNPVFLPLYSRLFPHERRFKRFIKGVWEEERKIIIANLRKLKKAVKAKPEDIVDSVLYPQAKFQEEISEGTAKLFASIMAQQGAIAMGQLETDLLFNVSQEAVVAWIESYVPQFSANLETVSVELLRQQLIAGIEAGEGIPALINRVNQTYNLWNIKRSEAIARSETLRASNQATLQAFKQSGVVKEIRWDTFIVRRTCDWCIEMDGTVVGIDKNFHDLGTEFAAPIRDEKHDIKRDDEGNALMHSPMKLNYTKINTPPLHTDCRCTLTAVIKED